jgi:hypothetical protein
MDSGIKTRIDSLIHNAFYISDIKDDIWSLIKNDPYTSFKDYDIEMFEPIFADRLKQYERKKKLKNIIE